MKPKHVLSLSVTALLILIIAALAGIRTLQVFAMIEAGSAALPPTTVSATEVTADVWEATLPAVGSVTAYQGTVVATEVAGIVSEIVFQPGSEVRAGDVLVQLEDSVERANLAHAQAQLGLARKSAVRSRELRERNSASQSELDAAEANVAAAEADLSAQQALLAKKRIVAPFAGRLGIRQISVGQFLSPGSPIVDLRSMSPVFVEFALPQGHLPQIAEGLPVRVRKVPGEPTGEISAIASLIDPATRNVTIQATFENTDGALRPGMFVETEVVLPDARAVRMIPQTAIIYNAYGDSVFLVEEKDGGLVARQAFVRLGERRGDFVEVVGGLELGQRLVRAGGFKLRNDMAIALSDVGVAEAKIDPTPEDR